MYLSDVLAVGAGALVVDEMGLVQEGLKKIAEKFASLDHVGPRDVADFDETRDDEARAISQRDAHEKVSFLLQELGII